MMNKMIGINSCQESNLLWRLLMRFGIRSVHSKLDSWQELTPIILFIIDVTPKRFAQRSVVLFGQSVGVMLMQDHLFEVNPVFGTHLRKFSCERIVGHDSCQSSPSGHNSFDELVRCFAHVYSLYRSNLHPFCETVHHHQSVEVPFSSFLKRPT